jgi:hypothetical protein
MVAFVLSLLPAAFVAVVRLLLDLIPSRRSRTGHPFLMAVAVMDSRAESVMIVTYLRPTHGLFVGILSTRFFNKTSLALMILAAAVGQTRTKSSELAQVMWSSQQQTVCSLPVRRMAGASRSHFLTWDEYMLPAQAMRLVHGRTWRTRRLRELKVAVGPVEFPQAPQAGTETCLDRSRQDSPRTGSMKVSRPSSRQEASMARKKNLMI